MSETDYIGWINSIVFIDKDGTVLSSKLAADDSDDPEDDRELDVLENAS